MFDGIVKKVQQSLGRDKIDGWLIYDFQRRNGLAIKFLAIDQSAHLTRRLFYWIPAIGPPIKIVHKIEPYFLDAWPGERWTYGSGQELGQLLGDVLLGSNKVAMEYSPSCAIPDLSLVDAGIVDVVRSFHCEVVSSAELIQCFTCVLDAAQLASHQAAAKVLEQIVADVWQLISFRLQHNQPISEYEVQQFIKSSFALLGCESDGDPLCAVNAHSSDPHYTPTRDCHDLISKGDFILIDLWCKQKLPHSVYADITRVAVASSQATERQKTIFEVVRKAQQETTMFIKQSFLLKQPVRGCDADQVARQVVNAAGYGRYFIHRTGHNIYTEAHGPGAHLDSIETCDERLLIPRTCFSVEPGIYLPGEFGVRLEYDVYISQDGVIEITGGVQEVIALLLQEEGSVCSLVLQGPHVEF